MSVGNGFEKNRTSEILTSRKSSSMYLVFKCYPSPPQKLENKLQRMFHFFDVYQTAAKFRNNIALVVFFLVGYVKGQMVG